MMKAMNRAAVCNLDALKENRMVVDSCVSLQSPSSPANMMPGSRGTSTW
ncbi:hypothetical protein SETIT_8G243000v2 [Setaria italica]|uniref:Uncharacterized protein n=1 Tax=Setaria italica TaxID=4555 RepID=K3ZKZ8_SETIT|nr:hypothetical protein SETIT_8G243000v2 [Setaria italica]RCV39677.1 hypothetical protein SETIT_8G243000v2 [Setaria italica]RCV39678.1 hypothetical protein SETIT_8G243000v2 [Setaria italica]